jgi:hypothetical protein
MPDVPDKDILENFNSYIAYLKVIYGNSPSLYYKIESVTNAGTIVQKYKDAPRPTPVRYREALALIYCSVAHEVAALERDSPSSGYLPFLKYFMSLFPTQYDCELSQRNWNPSRFSFLNPKTWARKYNDILPQTTHEDVVQKAKEGVVLKDESAQTSAARESLLREYAHADPMFTPLSTIGARFEELQALFKLSHGFYFSTALRLINKIVPANSDQVCFGGILYFVPASALTFKSVKSEIAMHNLEFKYFLEATLEDWHMAATPEARRFLRKSEKKCKGSDARFVYMTIITLATVKDWHVSVIIYDRTKNILEYFESSHTEFIRVFILRYDTLIRELQRKYFKDSTYVYTFGEKWQTGIQTDPYCLVWALFYMMMKLKFPNLHPYSLIALIKESIRRSKLDKTSIIAGFASFLVDAMYNIWGSDYLSAKYFMDNLDAVHQDKVLQEVYIDSDGFPFVQGFLQKFWKEMIKTMI